MTDDGSVSVLMLALLALAALLCLAASDAANVVMARARAQSAADAAALAAASSQWRLDRDGRQPADAAGLVARDNGAELVSCSCPAHGDLATVVVKVSTHIRMLAVAPRAVGASATAHIDLGAVFAPRRH